MYLYDKFARNNISIENIDLREVKQECGFETPNGMST